MTHYLTSRPLRARNHNVKHPTILRLLKLHFRIGRIVEHHPDGVPKQGGWGVGAFVGNCLQDGIEFVRLHCVFSPLKQTFCIWVELWYANIPISIKKKVVSILSTP